MNIPYSISEEEVLPFVKSITQSQVEELRAAIRGRVHTRTEASFAHHSRLFNGGIRSRACLVVIPVDALDISHTVVFCAKHSFSPSVKSGGYGTHGYSVEGDVIIDMSNMTDVEVSNEHQPMRPQSPKPEPMLTDAKPHTWPNSLLTPEEAPDILSLSRRRKADDAFEDDHQTGRSLTPPETPVPPRVSEPNTRTQPSPVPLRSAEPSLNDGVAPGNGDLPMSDSLTSSDPSSRLPSSPEGAEGKSPGNRRTRPRLGSPEASFSSFDAILHGVRDEAARRPLVSGPPAQIVPTSASSTRHTEKLLPPSVGSTHSSTPSRNGSTSGRSNEEEFPKGKTTATQTPGTSADEYDDDKPGSRSAQSHSPSVDLDGASDSRPSPHSQTAALPNIADGARAPTITVSAGATGNTDLPTNRSSDPSSPESYGQISGPFGYPSLPGNPTLVTATTIGPVGPFDYVMRSGPAATSPIGSGSARPQGPSAVRPPSNPIPPQISLSTPSSAEAANSTHTAYPIEPEYPFVYVTFGAGADQRTIDAHTTASPFKGTSATGQVVDVPYYVPFAAHPVGSTTMMLGGFGFMTRLHGLSLDALVEVEMVLSDGRIIVVSEHENSDLWWGVRGAGTAFGIATRYKAKAFPVPVVFAGNIVYDFEAATAPSLIKHFRDCIKSAPRELYANLILTAGPRTSGALVVIQLCYIGTREKGSEFLQAILSWDGGTCSLSEVNEKDYWNQQDSVAKVLKAAAGRKWFIRSDLVTSLTDDVIHQTVLKFAQTPEGCAWLFELAGGAMADFEDTCLPQSVRQASFNIVAFHQWRIEQVDEKCVDSAEEWLTEIISKHSPGGPLPSFFERKERVARTMATYGEENWSKLVELKRKYDTIGLIKHCFWPLGEDGHPLGLDREIAAADGVDGRRRVDSSPNASSQTTKGKGKEDLRTGNHFMDRLLRP